MTCKCMLRSCRDCNRPVAARELLESWQCEPLPLPATSTCKCGATVCGATVCADCIARDARDDRHGAARAYLAQIPRSYRWAALGAELEACVGSEAHRRAVEWLDGRGRFLLLTGKTESLKTTLACAMLRRELSRGSTTAWLVRALAVRPDTEEGSASLLRRALKGSLVVYDGLGEELSGAPPGGGVLAQRCERTRAIVHSRHDNDRRTIFTTGLEDSAIAAAYGDDVLRRLTDRHSTVIRMATNRKNDR